MKVSMNAWRSWPIKGAVLGVVALTALGLAYWSNVQDRERYLQSRNFRVLAVLARQTEELLENRSRVYREAITSTVRPSVPRAQWSRWSEWPEAHTVRVTEDANPAIHELAGGDVRVENPLPRPDARRPRTTRYTTRVTSEGSSLRFDWMPAGSDRVKASARVPAGEMLGGVFAPKLQQGAFDTLLLADTAGRVVYAAGRRASEMQAMSVVALLPPASAESRGSADGFGRMIAESPVHIAGVRYRLFAQPCCGGFVIVGLVEHQAMLQASLAISPVFVLTGAALVLAALVGWSFLKVALIGAQQRVTRLDVLQIGASGIFGLAMATILPLTASTYARLGADVDQQLEHLAGRLHAELSSEVTRAARQLTAMAQDEVLRDCVKPDAPMAREVGADGRPVDPCAAITKQWSSRDALPSREYEHFTAFALIDTSGFQRVKAASTRPTQRRVDVADRPYFHQARAAEGLWKLDACPQGCVLESHWSWTTGKPQVVMSTPTGLELYPVAAISIPIAPVLKPVLPPGFEFAVVDANGLVHFHSDTERNVHENLLLEADQNQRLRSLVTTHGAGRLDTSYWGMPYRAYVRPTLVPGWSIVTLHAKQPTRALVLEWSAVALMLQTAFMGLWIALSLAVLWSGTSFLWPDPRRRPWYRALALAYLLGAAAWAVVLLVANRSTTLWLGVGIPTVLWGLTWGVLKLRPADLGQVRGWTDLRWDYRLAATAILIVTAAMPAASFFAMSASQHVEAYIKERQLDLAQGVASASDCPSHSGPPVGPGSVRYDAVFYGSRVRCAPPAPPKPRGTAARVPHLPFEDYVPYFTSASVALRELMHRRADDDAWVDVSASATHLATNVAVGEPHYRLEVDSPVMSLVGVHTEDGQRFVWTSLFSLMCLVGVPLAAHWMVGYLLRRVVLADVVEPVRAGAAVPRSHGPHALVWCDDPVAMADDLKDLPTLQLTPIATAQNVANAWRAARRWISDLPSSQRMVVADLDLQSEDVAVMRRKMELLEQLANEADPSLLVPTRMSKRALASCIRDSWRWSQDSERWTRVIDRFLVMDRRQSTDGGLAQTVSALGSWWREFRAVLDFLIAGLRQWRRGRPTPDRGWRRALLDREATAYKPVGPYCEELQQTPAFAADSLTRDQILEEVEERASSVYRSLWESCDEDERVILEHVARNGLASAASRRVVRRLLARGLLRKDPALRLLNLSFRRFVLEAERRQEVASLERLAGPSLWDQLRVPIGMAAVLAAAFLAATQREAFNATLTMAAGVTTAVPTLVKLATLLTQLGDRQPGEQKGNA